MKNNLSEQQIASYRDNGFIVIPGFLDTGELASWREAWEEAVGARTGTRLPPGAGEGTGFDKNADGKDFYSNVFLQQINLWMSNDKMRKIMLDERLGKMAADLEGIDGIRIWHDQTLSKRPWDNPTGWHLDDPYWSFSSRQAISIWVALDDATYQNGCLYFLPGTHKSATYQNAGIGPNLNALFQIYPQWAKIQSVAAPMKAGDCSFHNGLTAHGAGANMTPGWRRAMTCGYMPDGSTFNGQQNILSKEQMAKLKVGDLLNDEKQNPLLYSRAKKPEAAHAG